MARISFRNVRCAGGIVALVFMVLKRTLGNGLILAWEFLSGGE